MVPWLHPRDRGGADPCTVRACGDDTGSSQGQRSREARALVLARSGGRCESPLCAFPDFKELTAAGEPVLDVDHVQDLALDGEDNPGNMIAVCPNCHATKTRGGNAEELREVFRETAKARHDAAMAQD